jgi:hypothetical protein
MSHNRRDGFRELQTGEFDKLEMILLEVLTYTRDDIIFIFNQTFNFELQKQN